MQGLWKKLVGGAECGFGDGLNLREISTCLKEPLQNRPCTILITEHKTYAFVYSKYVVHCGKISSIEEVLVEVQ